MARLGDVGKIITGNTPKTSDALNYSSNDICFVKPSDILDGEITVITDSEFYISNYARDKARILPPKSVLVTCIGIIGKVAINNVECAFNQQINAIVPDTSKCLTEYLAYAIQNKQKEMQDIANAPVVPILNKTQFSEIEIELPSIESQTEVVAKMRTIDDLISLRKQQLSKLDELVKSRFVELMGSAELSDEMTVEQITERVKVGFVGTCEKYYTDETGIPMLRTGNITDHGVDMRDLKYVTADFHEKNKKSKIRKGDLLIARHGSNGQANVYSGSEAQCLNAVVIVPNQSVARSVFLAGLINSPKVKEQIDRTLVGSTQHVVNTKSIANLVVRIPCLEVQEQYEAFVEQTDKSKFEIQKSLEKLETLKKALMQKYFG